MLIGGVDIVDNSKALTIVR